MIGVSKLLCGTVRAHDALRYGRQSSRLPHQLLQFASDKRPIVVWNMTRACNLHCVHCYICARSSADAGELSTEEGKALIDDLAAFGAPVLLFSGGEPLVREDLFVLGRYAVERGLRTVISTNGTLITPTMATRIKETGFSYVGVSLDGMPDTNDRFRGSQGAFAASLQGMRNCAAAGVSVGLRFTINRHNFGDLNDIFDLLEEERIPRACFYHLVYAGRGSRMVEEDLSRPETRQAVDLIFDRSLDFHRRGVNAEILTVDNHADGVYLYRRLESEGSERAAETLDLLRWNGGNQSGIAIADVDNLGNVHADQFWQHYSFGNVRRRPFSQIWTDTSDPLMAGLKNRRPLLQGRCAQCRYVEICNGNFRVRAEAVHGDVWAPDPACYLTDAEIWLERQPVAAGVE